MTKSRQQLSDWALWVYESKWLYAMGTYGQRLQTHYPTLARSWYYTSKNPDGFKVLTTAYQAGKNPRLYDCHGIKDGFMMDDDRTAEIDFDPSLDISADMEMNRCKADGILGKDYFPVKADFKDNAGWGYWKSGHFGIGVGDGLVVDIWATGYPARKRDQTLGGWTYCLKCYDISYESENDYMLYKGCTSGEAVREWQESLIKAGVAVSGGADGVFGSGTEAATKLFQVSVGITADGKVNDITYAKMLNKLQSLVITKTVSTGITKAQLDAVQAKLDIANSQYTKVAGQLSAATATVTTLQNKIAGAKSALA